MQRCLNRRHGEHQGDCTRLLHRTLCTAAEIIKQFNSRTSGWPVNCTRITDIDTIKSHRLHLEEANTEPFNGRRALRDALDLMHCRDAEAEKHREHLQHQNDEKNAGEGFCGWVGLGWRRPRAARAGPGPGAREGQPRDLPQPPQPS